MYIGIVRFDIADSTKNYVLINGKNKRLYEFESNLLIMW
jgi:hypothetical protein